MKAYSIFMATMLIATALFTTVIMLLADTEAARMSRSRWRKPTPGWLPTLRI